jgi:ubiquinone/menaquinone biosynthesis C-methylase UbiE
MNKPMRRWLLLIVVMLSIKFSMIASFLLMSRVQADDLAAQGNTSTAVEAPPARAERPRPTEEARRTYFERIVAAPMSHLGASWLVRPERQAEENAEKAMSQLGLVKGMTVCDLGCGNGYWTLPLARAVAEEGKVLAVDIQPEMLRQLRTRAGKARLDNIQPVLGTVDDPRLPADARVDLLLMVDVYHEFSHPESMLWAMRRSLADDGVIALLEYREEDPNVPIKPLHKMSKRQIMIEYKANGFKLVREYNELPWQHLMFFARDDSSLPAIEPEPFVAP